MNPTSQNASSQQTEDDGRVGPFCIQPKYDCPHLGDVAFLVLHSAQQEEGQQPPCVDCSQTKENWSCLHSDCNYVGCSRYQQKHMLNHYQRTGHNICLSWSDNSVFCYACDSYIDSPQFHSLNRHLMRRN